MPLASVSCAGTRRWAIPGTPSPSSQCHLLPPGVQHAGGAPRQRLASLSGVVARSSRSEEAGEPTTASPRTRADWPLIVGTLTASGAVAGTLLDGIHSRTGLQIYRMFPVDVAGLHTSLAVPPLLAAFYVVLGGLFIAADALLPGEETQRARQNCSDWRFVAAAFGVLAADLQLSAALFAAGTPRNAESALSAALFAAGTPPATESAVLALAAAATWFAFDRTKQGVALGAVVALSAPAAELVLLRVVPLWDYPLADVALGEWGSFVSWVPWCYFFYSPALGGLARLLHQACRVPESASDHA
ncbi:hypothetical protein FOA52_003126 [Chlamydomonas sp. UWO 241]|nr:hypothetical protein FOA52_003126 [Chlamydomonas sp. UWO 241]